MQVHKMDARHFNGGREFTKTKEKFTGFTEPMGQSCKISKSS
ncbi:MAG: hypothetical protein WAW23_08335 [Candidatus Methanoperedens sp.]